MSDDTKPMKRSEMLAVENVRRITEQMRSERNDAIALAQVRREQLGSAVTLLKQIVGHRAALPAELAGQVDTFLANLELD